VLPQAVVLNSAIAELYIFFYFASRQSSKTRRRTRFAKKLAAFAKLRELADAQTARSS
jgi:hypothetical protein